MVKSIHNEEIYPQPSSLWISLLFELINNWTLIEFICLPRSTEFYNK